MHDYLIIGAGPYGCAFARAATDAGKRCLVIDRRNHLAGNCYSEKRDGIEVHVYGPHIFHCNDQEIWDFVNRFGSFNIYRHQVKSRRGGKLYTLPISLQTLTEVYGHQAPENLLAVWERSKILTVQEERDCEAWERRGIALFGRDIFNLLIRDYSRKQWGSGAAVPEKVLRRLAIRENYDSSYFSDRYQGIPVEGYTRLYGKMLEGIECRLGVDYQKERASLGGLAKQVVYTGALDELYGHCLGSLEWRCLEFQHERVQKSNVQGMAVLNEAGAAPAWTRTTEHRHFRPEKAAGEVSWITREVPGKSGSPAYPVETKENRALWRQYRDMAAADGLLVGGRLGEYRYYDMHQAIGSALQAVRRLLA